MVEVIELLDSDEEGDERIRIVQRQNEQDVRPVGEEGRRDGDVVITGTRAPHAEERKKERRALELSRRWFFLPSRSGDLFLNEEAFLTWVPTNSFDLGAETARRTKGEMFSSLRDAQLISEPRPY